MAGAWLLGSETRDGRGRPDPALRDWFLSCAGVRRPAYPDDKQKCGTFLATGFLVSCWSGRVVGGRLEGGAGRWVC
jgi:hypothetical protein